MRKLRVHYMDCNDNEVVAEIDAVKFVEMALATVDGYSGNQFATQLDSALTVINTDPRESEFEDTDIFVSYVDIRGMLTSPLELVNEIQEDLMEQVLEVFHSPKTGVMSDRQSDLEKNGYRATAWWRNLSINQQKELNAKHFPNISNYLIENGDNWITRMWENEGRPEPQELIPIKPL